MDGLPGIIVSNVNETNLI